MLITKKTDRLFISLTAIIISLGFSLGVAAQTGGTQSNPVTVNGISSGKAPTAVCDDTDRMDSSCAAFLPPTAGNISNTTGYESKIELIPTPCPAPNQAYNSITRRTSLKNLTTGATTIVSEVITQTCPTSYALNVAVVDAVSGNYNARLTSDTPAGAISCGGGTAGPMGADCQEIYSASGAPTNVVMNFAPGQNLPAVGYGYTYTVTGLPVAGAGCTARYENTVSGPAWKDGIQMNCSGDNVACTGFVCSILMNKARTVSIAFSANAPVIPYNLTTVPVGSGFVTNGASISCGGSCVQAYTTPTVTTLYAIPQSGHTFTGWSGGGCSGLGDCTLTAGTADITVTANFAPVPPPSTYTLYAFTVGAGTGTVTSAPAGINCGGDCSEVLAASSAVTVTATPTGGSTFAGWSGDCSGVAVNCALSMTTDRYAVASFSPPGPVAPTCNAGTLTATWPAASTLQVNIGGVNNATSVDVYMAHTSGTPSAYPAISLGGGNWQAQMTGASTAGDYTISVRMNNASFTGTVCTNSLSTRPASSTTYTLTVNKAGLGANTNTGTVSSNISINCGGVCSQSNIASGTAVTLTATPTANQTFAGWGGACAAFGTAASCNLSITADTTVSASFMNTTPLGTYALSVVKAGTGAANCTITSSSPASPVINCGASCTQNYNPTTIVSLPAPTPAVGTTWNGWSGICSGTGTCSTTMNSNQSVTATCTIDTYGLTVTKSGTGTGTVTSAPAGINCGATCAATYNYNTSVTLTATPTVGHTFIGWSGAGCAGVGTCTVSMTAARSVNAQFNINTYTLNVGVTGGSGSITGSGISCPGTCSAVYNYGTVVPLSANPSAGYALSSWAGDCGGAGACSVTMTANHSVTASFYSTCTPTSETSSGACTGYDYGSISYQRDYSCPSGTWSGWYQTGSSCGCNAGRTWNGSTCVNNCTPTSETSSYLCTAIGYDTGTVPIQRDYTCPAAAWGAWYEIAGRTCACNAGRTWNGSTCVAAAAPCVAGGNSFASGSTFYGANRNMACSGSNAFVTSGSIILGESGVRIQDRYSCTNGVWTSIVTYTCAFPAGCTICSAGGNWIAQ